MRLSSNVRSSRTPPGSGASAEGVQNILTPCENVLHDLRSLWHPCDRTNIRSPTSSISSAWRWDVPIEAAGCHARANGFSDLARAPRYAGKVARHPSRPPSPLEPSLSCRHDIRPGEEDVRRTAARELGTGVQDRQSTRNSTANHHLSSAHGARTHGGRGAQVLHPLLGSSATQASTRVVHDARAAPKRPAHINSRYGLMPLSALDTAMPIGRAWGGSGTYGQRILKK